MIFTIIGVGVFCYGLLHTMILFFIDSDIQLFFCEKFGKSIRRMKGKVVFITGASSGIGEHTAIALAKHGVRLVLAARRSDELERVKQTCIDVSKGQLSEKDILVIPMDLLDSSSHDPCFELAVQHFGGVDILFNNAGRSQRAMFDNIELAVDRQLFDLNVFAVINLSRVALNHFNKRGHGHIAITSSMAGLFGVPFSATYTGSKHALHGYFNALRTEKIGKQITVTLLCPGPIYTNFLSESFTEQEGKKYGVSAQPTDRRMSGERCGELCAVSLANKCSESWMGLYPSMFVCYLVIFFPQVYSILLRMIGTETMFKMRDGPNADLRQGQKGK